jgi:enterochelin esterase-like enzyme
MAPNGDIRAQFVMDNLIYRHEIPVMIAVFINPGRRPDQPEATLSEWGDRTSNRPTEYNVLDDKYAQVIVNEVLPVVYKDYNVSKDPERHGIGGSSSGAIAAFTVAWNRPDQFRKILSNVGSFTNIRGGDAYAEIVRKADKKPLRIFMVDGRNDNRGAGRNGYNERNDWFLQNVRLEQALTEKGYDVNYEWGIQSHGQKMLRAVLPDMLRWLWRDHGVDTNPKNVTELAPVKATHDMPTTSPSAALTDAEQRWADALVKNDAAALTSIMNAKYVDTDEDGNRSDRAAVLDVLKSGDLKLTSLTLSDMKVQMFGTYGVVTGAAAQSGTFKGQPVAPKLVFTDTFVIQDGRWTAVSSQRTRVK